MVIISLLPGMCIKKTWVQGALSKTFQKVFLHLRLHCLVEISFHCQKSLYLPPTDYGWPATLFGSLYIYSTCLCMIKTLGIFNQTNRAPSRAFVTVQWESWPSCRVLKFYGGKRTHTPKHRKQENCPAAYVACYWGMQWGSRVVLGKWLVAHVFNLSSSQSLECTQS